MPSFSLSTLPWLPRVPADFARRCKAPGLGLRELRLLAAHGLDESDLVRLGRAASRLREASEEGRIEGLIAYRLGVVGNATMKLLSPLLAATGLRHRLDVTVVEGEFDQTLNEAMCADSVMRSAMLDGVFVALDSRGLPGLEPGVADDEDAAVKQAADHLRMICHGLLEAGRRQLFVQNIVCPPGGLFGNLDARMRGSQRRRVERFNEAIHGILDECGGLLVDVAGLAASVGHERWFDARQWHIAKLPFAPELGPLYSDHVMRLIGAVNGSSRKCLVLDLDNTLWGGVVGDDGVHGLVLGQGDALGEAFVAVQQTARLLRQRGIILAVCSKNDEQNARAPFREHPDMVLREEDIAVFQANWQDKASNLEAIARALDIGTDALVFLDDNPAEREQVRQALPEVAVPELTQDASDYPVLLLAGGYFEAVSFTDDDRARAAQYQANAKRAQLAGAARDMGEYLASLDMVINFARFDATGRSRIAQLTQRSNQFNLTTRRYDEAAIGAFEQREDAFTLQVRLADRFGDNGMISVIICVEKDREWEIDTWLMSCRVVNRRVEQAVLDVLTSCARHRGIERLIGRYIPTEKNSMVRDHYAKLGFQAVGARDGADLWMLDTASYMPAKPPMRFVLAAGLSNE